METSLRSSEWVILSTFLLLFVSLCLSTQIKASKISYQFEVESDQPEKIISVSIQGAVSRPGVYLVPEGTQLKKILKKSRPNKTADLGCLDIEAAIERSVEFCIEEKKIISVWIFQEGTNPVRLRLPVGSRFCDLKSKIEKQDSFDFSIFKKKRLLRDGEEIFLIKKKD
jgi:hypothetical protein